MSNCPPTSFEQYVHHGQRIVTSVRTRLRSALQGRGTICPARQRHELAVSDPLSSLLSAAVSCSRFASIRWHRHCRPTADQIRHTGVNNDHLQFSAFADTFKGVRCTPGERTCRNHFPMTWSCSANGVMRWASHNCCTRSAIAFLQRRATMPALLSIE